MSEQKVKIKVTHNVVHLPAIALRGLVVFPNNIIHFEVGRAKSIAAIEAAMHGNSSIFLVAQKETDTEEPTAADLYSFGVIAEIKQVLRVSDELVRVLVEACGRTPGTLNGRLDNNLVVEFPGEESLIGQWAEVELTGSRAALLVGRKV